MHLHVFEFSITNLNFKTYISKSDRLKFISIYTNNTYIVTKEN